MLTSIRQWFLKIVGKSIIPLIERAVGVTQLISDTLGYLLAEIISGKLEIPDGTPITNTLHTILGAVKAVNLALESALRFLGVEPVAEVKAHSIEDLKKSTEDLKRFVESLQE